MKEIFKMLKLYGISIDKKEFEFQYHSFNNESNFAVIKDTLSFFNIESYIVKLESDTNLINLLPKYFISLRDWQDCIFSHH